MSRSALLFFVFQAVSFLPAAAFGLEGVINVGPEEIIKAKGEDIMVPGYSVPSFEDWNNDQLQDLVIGEGSLADLSKDGVVDNVDLRLFADLWLAEHATKDTSSPQSPLSHLFP